MGENSGHINDLYRQDLGRQPLLSAEEEFELGRRIQTGDTAALNKMINSNLRLVVHVAGRYSRATDSFPSLSMDDIIQEGNIGLMAAAKRFDPEQGIRFVHIASYYIRSHILNMLKNRGRAIRIPSSIADDMVAYEKVIEQLTQTYGRMPTAKEAAKYMHIPLEKIYRFQKYAQIRREDDIHAVGSDEDYLDLWDFVPDEQRENTDDDVERRTLRKNLMTAVAEQLNEDEQYIINERIGNNEIGAGRTLMEVGLDLGVTNERVRQREEKIVDKLRNLDFEKMGYGREVEKRQRESLGAS